MSREIAHDTAFGPWRYTRLGTGRRLTHVESGYVVHVDALRSVAYERTGKTVEVDGAPVQQWRGYEVDGAARVDMAMGHVSRKPWAVPGTVARLRDALVALGLAKQVSGRAA